MPPAQYLQVAVGAPLSRLFDYLPPDHSEYLIQQGGRVLVPFGRQKRVGIVVGMSDHSDTPKEKLKAALEILDPEPVLSTEQLKLLNWASRYYAHPIGEVMIHALPTALRDAETSLYAQREGYALTDDGKTADAAQLSRAPLQRKLLLALQESPAALPNATLQTLGSGWRNAIQKLQALGYVTPQTLTESAAPECAGQVAEMPHDLNAEQQQACQQLGDTLSGFQPALLHGVTGSGKTEVYTQVANRVLEAGKQVLLLVPEIGLTPQLTERLRARLNAPVHTWHSGMNDTERLQVWRWSRRATPQVLVGTRSAIFTPLPKLGLIILDEEHDASFKQQDGFRYHARSLALMLGKQRDIPVILGSATPSAETLHHAQAGRYLHCRLRRRAAKNATVPSVQLVDLKQQSQQNGIGHTLLQEIKKRLASKEQVLIFLNRRGYAPVLQCNQCGEAASCKRCDAKMTIHHGQRRLRCHHCGAERPLRPQCEHCDSRDVVLLGQGTERIEQDLQALLPEARIARIDRDTTRRKNALADTLTAIHRGDYDILIGTQMLAKGHDFPDVTLVGVLNADGGLFGVDFRSAEQMGQLITQVAGRAGRAERRGHVIIQTRVPDHPLLLSLIRDGYETFMQEIFAEREALFMPPFGRMALVRCESHQAEQALDFLSELRDTLQASAGEHIELFGPASAAMERRAGRFRALLFCNSPNAAVLIPFMNRVRQFLESHPAARKIRWSLDIDPMDTL